MAARLKGEAGEYSDVVALVDASLNGEGADSDMPAHIWEQVVGICWRVFKPSPGYHILVRIQNVS